MSQPLVSIITPLYNRKHLISRCVKSVCNQTYKNLEIIVVDDGSTDNPDDVLSELARDSRVRILRQSNSGVSAARNLGIETAKGEYIMFLDSDDAMLPPAVEWCVREAEASHADCVTYAHCHCGTEQEPPIATEVHSILLTEEESIKNAFQTNRLFAMWNKLYRRQLLGDLRLLTDVSWGEDFIFSLSYLQKCNSVAVLDAVLVNITTDSPNSLNKRYRPQMFADCTAQYKAIQDYLQSHPSPEITRMFQTYMWWCLMACVRKLCLLAPLSYRDKVRELKSWANSELFQSLPTEYCPRSLTCSMVKKRFFTLLPAIIQLGAMKSHKKRLK